MLSIIIPAKNEQDYLPLLLQSIKKQSFSDYEIIIADAGSKDKTLEIAKSYGCVITKGGLPATGRNNGAKVARGEILFFLDADTVLPANFLKNSLHEFADRHLDIASFKLIFKNQKNKAFFLDKMYNEMIVILEKTLPFSVMGTLIKRDFFEKLHGYNEKLTLSEDADFGRRAVKLGAKFGVIRSTEILISDRRFVKDGWFKTITKYFLSEMHTLFIGPITSDIFKYKFDHYKEENKK